MTKITFRRESARRFSTAKPVNKQGLKFIYHLEGSPHAGNETQPAIPLQAIRERLCVILKRHNKNEEKAMDWLSGDAIRWMFNRKW
jgi:hypothetical protein